MSLNAEKLLVKERSDIPDHCHSSELRVFEALHRRGVAMAFADILSWECHQRMQIDIASALGPASEPEQADVAAGLEADRQVFMYRIRIKRLPDNTLDLDSKIFEALHTHMK